MHTEDIGLALDAHEPKALASIDLDKIDVLVALTPEAAAVHCGPGLAEVCEVVGIPPVLHCGSCVDNSRILIAASEMVRVGGLGNSIADLPAAGCAPEYMSEKAICIGAASWQAWEAGRCRIKLRLVPNLHRHTLHLALRK